MCADRLENRHSEAKFSALLQFCKLLEWPDLDHLLGLAEESFSPSGERPATIRPPYERWANLGSRAHIAISRSAHPTMEPDGDFRR
jgi:hypothetical protein